MRQHVAAHEANTGCGWSKVFATASCAPLALERRARGARRDRAGRNGESQGTVTTSALRRPRHARRAGRRAAPRSRRPRPARRDAPNARVAVEVLVGVDQHVADLRREALEHVRDHRLAVELDQSLVDAAHPPALAAGEHDAGDVRADAITASGGSLSARQPRDVLLEERVALRRAVDRIVERGERRRASRPATLPPSKKSFVPQARQNLRNVPGDDSYTARSSAPAVIVTCGDRKPTQVTNAAPCARRQLSQWQCATKRDGKRATKRTRPHMAAAARLADICGRGAHACRRAKALARR